MSTTRVTAIVVAVTALIVFSASPAAPVGDPALNRTIVDHPVPGWERTPDKKVRPVVEVERRAIGSVTDSYVEVAGSRWSHGKDNAVLIVIVRVEKRLPQPARQGRQGAISVCLGATSNAPTAVVTLAEPVHAVEATCKGTSPSGTPVDGFAISWAKGRVLVFMSASGLPAPTFEAIAVSQGRAIDRAHLG
jgi:hypothetical protein